MSPTLNLRDLAEASCVLFASSPHNWLCQASTDLPSLLLSSNSAGNTPVSGHLQIWTAHSAISVRGLLLISISIHRHKLGSAVIGSFKSLLLEQIEYDEDDILTSYRPVSRPLW